MDYVDFVKIKMEGLTIPNHSNSLLNKDKSFHQWYRFILSFPPHLVRYYIKNFNLNSSSTILDPFCGTGTTLVEAKLNKIRSIGIEANPFPAFASSVKTNWDVDPKKIKYAANKIVEEVSLTFDYDGIDDDNLIWNNDIKLISLDKKSEQVLIKNSISPKPLHKTLVLLDVIKSSGYGSLNNYLLLALGTALVNNIGNLRFGPEVGVGKIKEDVSVLKSWMNEIDNIVSDLESIPSYDFPDSKVYVDDARNLTNLLSHKTIDAVITSPPYPNEKEYTRITRLESTILGFYSDILNIRGYKKNLVRSNTRAVYKNDDDDKWISDIPEIIEIADKIEYRRKKLGKTSGFEKLYSKVTKQYFGGMARHFESLREVLKPNAKLAYVVGDQASYLGILIRTSELLSIVAAKYGYKTERIDFFRNRFATASQEELREDVLILNWPGKS